jgi:hypothetical protein
MSVVIIMGGFKYEVQHGLTRHEAPRGVGSESAIKFALCTVDATPF